MLRKYKNLYKITFNYKNSDVKKKNKFHSALITLLNPIRKVIYDTLENQMKQIPDEEQERGNTAGWQFELRMNIYIARCK